MSLERVVGVTVALLLLGSVAVKKTDNIQARQDADKTAIVQLADVVSDAFAADVALAGNDTNPRLIYGEAITKFGNPSTQDEAVRDMENLVGAHPTNKEFMKGLASFYTTRNLLTETINFFTTFTNAQSDTLSKNQTINKMAAKCLYDVAVKNMYTLIPDFYKPNGHPTFSDYEPVVKALELAVSLQPAKIPKGDELFWANAHYELGWGYRRFSTLGSLEESPSWSKKSVDEHITSVKIGGKKFVQSKRDRTPIGFTDARGNLPLYELIVKIDPHPIWKKALEEEKAIERVYGK